MLQKRHIIAPGLLSALLLAAAATAAEGEIRVIVVPVDFEVQQVTAGGVPETLAGESELACRNLDEAVARWLTKHPAYRPVLYPDLSDDEESLVREHIALFNVAMNEAWVMIRQYRRGPFDYTVGDGLAFVAERTGADKAMIVAGARLKSTGGRTAMKFLEFLLYGALSPLEQSFLSAGIIDLRSGRIEWANLENVSGEDVEVLSEACDAVDKLMAVYPGGDFSTGATPP